MPDLKKASDYAASLIARLDTNAPLLIALAIASIVGVFASSGLRPEWQFVFRILAVFFVTGCDRCSGHPRLANSDAASISRPNRTDRAYAAFTNSEYGSFAALTNLVRVSRKMYSFFRL